MTSRLASMLVQDGLVTTQRMADAFQRQVIFGGTLDTILLEMGLLEVPVLLDYLVRATGLPLCDELPATDAAAAVDAGFTVPMAERFHGVPMGRAADGKLRVLLLDLPDREPVADLEEALGRQVAPYVGPEYRFHQAAERLFGIPLPPRFTKLVTRLEGGAGKSTPIARSPSLMSGRFGGRSSLSTSPGPGSPSRGAAPRAPGPTPEAPSLPPRQAPLAPPSAGTSAGPAWQAPSEPPGQPSSSALAPSVAPPRGVPVVGGGQAPPAGGVWRGPPQTYQMGQPARDRRDRRPGGTLSGLAPVNRGGDARDPREPASHGAERPAPGRSSPLSAPLPPAAPDDEHPPTVVDIFVGVPGPGVVEAPTAPSGGGGIATGAVAALLEGPPLARFAADTVSFSPPRDGYPEIEGAADRDTVLESLCRIARERFAFAAVFLVHRDVATLTMALGDDFLDRATLRSVELPLEPPSPLRMAVTTRSPFLGLLGEEELLGETLAFLGRRVPVWGAILPIVLRKRVVALLHIDDGGRVVSGDDLAAMVPATAAAAEAFVRIIAAQKQGAAAAGEPSLASVAPRPPSSRPRRPPPSVAQAHFRRPRVTDLPGEPAPGAPLDPAAVDRLLQLVEQEDPVASPAAAATVVLGGALAARSIAERFPGPVRFPHRKLQAIGLPLAELGPLLPLAVRMGMTMVAPLVERLVDPSPDTRFYTALVLAEIRAESAIVPLSHHLFDPDAVVRRAAAYALARQTPSPPLGRLLDQIREELTSDDLARQRAAAAAAGELRDVTAVPRLIDLLTHRDMEVVDLAHRSLLLIAKQDFGTARWRWRSWWEKARTQSRSEWLLGGLEQSSAEARRSAVEELNVIVTDRLGYHARFSRRERDDAARRFADWLALHPEALDDRG